MIHERTLLLIGQEGLDKLARARVAVVGLGGVGGAAAEQLCRAGVGQMTLIDFDEVKASNINRQILALGSTLGRVKAQVAAERFADIRPECDIEVLPSFVGSDTIDSMQFERFDFVLDCIDSLNPKVGLIRHCVDKGVPLVVSTGAGGRIDPEGVRIIDLFETENCPLSKHLRKRLRNQNVEGPIPCVHSKVKPQKLDGLEREAVSTDRGRARAPIGSISYVPVVFGCVMAAYVVRSLLGEKPGLEDEM